MRHISPVVAHQLNNLFTIIHGYAQQLQIKHDGDPISKARLKLITEASTRAANIVRAATPLPDEARESSAKQPAV